jgi:hypothetical protein
MKNEDQEWIDALAGNINNKDATPSQIQALAVRRALIARRESIESDTKKIDKVKYEKLKQTLTTNGHLLNGKDNKKLFKRKIELIASFIAGSFSSGLLIFSITNQVMITRGNSEINHEAQIIQTESQNLFIIQSDDPIALAQSLEILAWEINLKTNTEVIKENVFLEIENLPRDDIKTSQLKLIIGINPTTQGNIKIKITKDKF